MSLLGLPGITVPAGGLQEDGPATLRRLCGQSGEPTVFVLALPVDPEAWRPGLEAAASPGRRTAAARFRQPLDALRCLAAEALFRHGAAELWQLAPEALATAPGHWGKPFLVGHPHRHFNLSHSGPWLLCAFHDGPVGVDVEAASSKALDAAAASLSPAERSRLEGLGDEDRAAACLRLWTLKESLLKAAGTGLGHDPRSLTLDGPSLEAAGAPPPPAGRSWALRVLPMPAGAQAALCFAAAAGCGGATSSRGGP
ncbi:MAG: 4'-phosphopantetheinyl transferase superfamily protein [Holophagaceae bacterium]|nr:4'-phosphopantetheinyl transferase superfamily protein [Holophagaceae bacterium]